MIPYVHVGPITLGPISIDVEALLTIVGLVVGIVLVNYRARRLGIESGRVNSFLVWLLVGAVVGGHLSDVLCFRFGEIVEISAGQVYWQDPWELLRFWHGWRSVGGCIGAIIACLVWSRYRFCWGAWLRVSGSVQVEGYRFVRRERPETIVALADTALFVFPIVWALNRMGSALIHEHPGTRAPAGALFAVAYPRSTTLVSDGFDVVYGAVPRYDLGLLELFATLPFVLGTFLFWKRPYRSGLAIYVAGLTYPPARFALDFFARKSGELAEPRIAGVTPTQWGFAVIWMVALLAVIRGRGSVGVGWAGR